MTNALAYFADVAVKRFYRVNTWSEETAFNTETHHSSFIKQQIVERREREGEKKKGRDKEEREG